MLPERIEHFTAGSFTRTPFSANVMNQIVDAINPLLAMEGTDGLRVTKSDSKFLIGFSGSFSGSAGGGEGSAVSFRGRWNASTAYAEGDVVFLDGTAEQEEMNAHTWVAKIANTNQKPPDTTVAYEDTYWRIVAIGSWPTFVVSYPPTAPADERQVTIAPGAIQTHFSGSAGTGDGSDDYTEIVGGVVTIQGKLIVNGPVNIVFGDGTNVVIDIGDMDQEGSDLNGKTFKLREVDICIDGVIKKMGVIGTDPYDAT